MEGEDVYKRLQPTPGSFLEPTQEPDSDGEVDEDQNSLEGRAELRRTQGRVFAPAYGGKEPWAPVAYEEPDLAEYFSGFEGLTEASQIAICRTYANYLAARARREPVKRRKRSILHTAEEFD